MSKIIITNNTDLPMKVITRAISDLYEYPISTETIITYQGGKYYCYIKENKKSIGFTFNMDNN